MGLIILFVLITLNTLNLTKSESVFTRLYADLFKDGKYLPAAIPMTGPPLQDMSHAINISVGLSIISLDMTSHGVLSATTWVRLFWHDYRLQWSPDDYQGVKSIRVPPSNIWRPDLSIYNAAAVGCGSFEDSLAASPALAIIYSSGDILWMPPVAVHVKCSTGKAVENDDEGDGDNHNDDDAKCSIKLGSWTYDGHHINLTPFGGSDYLDLSDMSPNTAYRVTSQRGNAVTTKYYPCCDEPYPAMDYTFYIKNNKQHPEDESSEESSEEDEDKGGEENKEEEEGMINRCKTFPGETVCKFYSKEEEETKEDITESSTHKSINMDGTGGWKKIEQAGAE